MAEDVTAPKVIRRTEMDLLVQILSYLKATPARKTQLMNGCNMNHAALRRYINRLVENGHVIAHPLPRGFSFYTISDSGNQLLLTLQAALGLVQEVLA